MFLFQESSGDDVMMSPEDTRRKVEADLAQLRSEVQTKTITASKAFKKLDRIRLEAVNTNDEHFAKKWQRKYAELSVVSEDLSNNETLLLIKKALSDSSLVKQKRLAYLRKEARRMAKSEKAQYSSSDSDQGKKKRNKDIECFYCHLKGHFRNNCPSLKRGKPKPKSKDFFCFICGKTDHSVYNCPNKKTEPV